MLLQSINSTSADLEKHFDFVQILELVSYKIDYKLLMLFMFDFPILERVCWE